MYPFLARKIVYPLGDLVIGTSVMKYLYLLLKTQWWSPERLRDLQNQKLIELIKHSYENVPYYYLIFKKNKLTYKDIKTIDDLEKLPILTRDNIHQNIQDKLARNFKKWSPIANSTGGSTGEPLKYFITKELASISWAGMFRGWGWAGYRIGDKRISFGGSSLIPNKSSSFFEITRHKLERNLPLSAVSMNEARYNKYINIIHSYKPKYIYGYASSIYLLADYCKSHDIKTVHFDAVFTTAEVLIPHYRTSIEQQFQCKVFDQYGSYDGGGQALECQEHQGFHITAEKVILEIVDENGQLLPSGKPGRIILTDLNNYAMPFLRYDVGDIGIIDDKPCNCGRGLPILKSVEGRITDIIKLSNGISIAGPAVTLIFKDCHVKQYQLIQISEDKLLVKIVKDIGYTEEDTQYIMNVLSHHVGKEISIGFEFCDQIQVEKNGKFRFIISKIN